MFAMKTILMAASALASMARAADEKPATDIKALAPILSHSWAEGSCAAPVTIRDWVIDIDGTPFERFSEASYTPLTELSLKGSDLTVKDEVGIGSTVSVYHLREDGALQLWSEIEDQGDPADGAGPPMIRVKGGKLMIGDDGQPQKPSDTSALLPCPLRTQLFPADAVAALGGNWADVRGGSCAKGTGAIMIDFARPVPTFSIGPTEDQQSTDYWILEVAQHSKTWELTAGDSFEANVFHLAPGPDGSLTVKADYEAAKPVTYKRCPK